VGAVLVRGGRTRARRSGGVRRRRDAAPTGRVLRAGRRCHLPVPEDLPGRARHRAAAPGRRDLRGRATGSVRACRVRVCRVRVSRVRVSRSWACRDCTCRLELGRLGLRGPGVGRALEHEYRRAAAARPRHAYQAEKAVRQPPIPPDRGPGGLRRRGDRRSPRVAQLPPRERNQRGRAPERAAEPFNPAHTIGRPGVPATPGGHLQPGRVADAGRCRRRAPGRGAPGRGAPGRGAPEQHRPGRRLGLSGSDGPADPTGRTDSTR
jgi:hypothetical protein